MKIFFNSYSCNFQYELLIFQKHVYEQNDESLSFHIKFLLLLCGYGHAVSIQAVDIILLPPFLHSIHAKRFGIQNFVKNTLEEITKQMFSWDILW